MAELDLPEQVRGSVVICHPHPRMGGTMQAPLLLALRDALLARDWAVLRFNFRGVEGSAGTSGTGPAEVGDALGAFDALRSRNDGTPLACVGWSFGGAVAIRAAAEDPDLSACVGIAPAIVRRAGVAAGLPRPAELGLKVPLLVVCGSNDESIPPAECRRWAEEAGAIYRELAGGNHFFWGKYDDLNEEVVTYLAGHLEGEGGA